ncbi:MAG: YkgJ family cysteine cluster protein [Candidatus Helarchaeota archaeon]
MVDEEKNENIENTNSEVEKNKENDAGEQRNKEQTEEISSEVSDEKGAEKEEKKTEQPPKKRRKFVFECTECGACCYRTFPIYFEDIKRWSIDQTLPRVLPYLKITEVEPAGIQITFRKVKNEDGKEVCPFYTPGSNNRCGIFFSKPISCVAFPLGYDKATNRYYIVDKTCEGLNRPVKMTAERLKEMRENSKLEYECRIRTFNVLPLLHLILLQYFNEQSQKVMESLSPEDREKIEKILQKSKVEEEKAA